MLRVENLSFAYRDYLKEDSFKPVLEELELSLEKGKKLIILGSVDSGKSTLARLLCALIPRHLDGQLTGKIKLDDLNISRVEPYNLTSKVTLINQNPSEQLLMTTVSDEVAFPLESLAKERPFMIGKVKEALEKWSLENLELVNPSELSGGEQRRLLLAVADAIDAPFWIMDETFDDLDDNYKKLLAKRIKEDKRTMLLFASRYLREYENIFDQWAYLKNGKLIFGSKEEVLELHEKTSENLFNFKKPINKKRTKQILNCRNAQIIHKRRSLASNSPFILNVTDFYLESGEVVALVGPNGSGKSTFSRALCALEELVKGSITINENQQSSTQLQRQVGYLFQNPDFGIFLPTVKEELGFSLRKDKTLSSKEKSEIVNESATLFHLDVDDNPSMMSFGAKKHLQAAIFYILNRPFIIMDELDSGLTSVASAQILNLFKASGAAVLVITHNKNFALEFCQRQYKIVDSNVIETEVGL